MKQKLLLSLFVLFSASTARAAVGDVLASGSCGTGMTWTLTENGERAYRKINNTEIKAYDGVTLTISGTGEVTSTDYKTVTGLFGSGDALANNFITSVIVEEGVTSLPGSAFFQFYILRHVSLPSTLTTIGNSAFYNCDALKSIVIPDGVTQIPQQAFNNCDSLRIVSLGKGVTQIGNSAFKDCVRLMTLRMTRYEPTDGSNPITSFRNVNGFEPFSGCVSLASIVVPEAGKTRYLQYENGGETYSTFWDSTHFKDADNDNYVYFRELIRTDRETLFAARAANEWTEWVDKFNHAAPRGAEVYAVGGFDGRAVKLNRITATVTLPAAEREGAGDDGVRALIPAFVPVLIKRPSGALTEDLKMHFVMGGELSPENGWYGPSSVNASLWGTKGTYTNEAVYRGYVPSVVPDIMASVPYGYHNIDYTIEVLGSSPSGRKDHIIAFTVDGTTFYGNADKTSAWNSSSNLKSHCSFTLDGDQFRRFTDEEMEAGLAPQHTALFVLSGDLGGDLTSPLLLSVNERTEVTIADGADNTDAIAAAASTTSNRVTLSGRTLYTDGDWNTLCLPFGVNLVTSSSNNADFFFSFLLNNTQDAIVMELDTEETYDGHQTGFDATDGTLYLYFRRVYAIEAGKPYIVKWNSRQGYVSNPVFYDADISSDAPTAVTSADGTVTFVGNYSPFEINAGNIDEIIYLGSGNTIGYASAPRMLRACRAHFVVPTTAGSVKEFKLSFNDEDNADGIHSIENGQLTIDNETGAWYDLSGRKIANGQQPTAKGLYIHNGKKTIIK